MKEKEYRRLSDHEIIMLETLLREHIIGVFGELLDATWVWLQTEEAREYFYQQQEMFNIFIAESRIQDRWNDIITERAKKGVDITGQIYEYARQVNTPEGVVHFTPAEQKMFNQLCDYNYELIRNVGADEVRAIRKKLLEDAIEGVNPRRTSLRELQLQPINGLSPQQRAVTIARTENARAINTATLMTMKEDGVMFVTPLCSTDCKVCNSHVGDLIPIDEALDEPLYHPNCGCSWTAAVNPETGTYTIDGGEAFEQLS
ncbi:MAG: hypothetical protein BZ138_07395 [Methanosphaera sp. rholeuAM270]|nr:MAG: hypothetical protein BZ138_07395 [Methanosphaera sp. rholeuAM270]